MKWKDTGDMAENEGTDKEEYFDEEQYSPWTTRNISASGGKLSKIPMVLIFLGLAIVTSMAALLMLLLSTRGDGDAVTREQVAVLEGRMRQLEERLDKYDALDEKVTRIWEEAKSYGKFKDRFDRSEASISLRMDHLTMSLETLQKQLSAVPKTATSAPSTSTLKPNVSKPQKTSALKLRYHTVSAGDTFFNISKKYDVSVEALLKMNHLEKDSVLKIGQKIIVRKGDEK